MTYYLRNQQEELFIESQSGPDYSNDMKYEGVYCAQQALDDAIDEGASEDIIADCRASLKEQEDISGINNKPIWEVEQEIENDVLHEMFKNDKY
jgi:hypothetical protein